MDPASQFHDSYRYTVNPIGHFDPNGAVDLIASMKTVQGGSGNASVYSESYSLNLNKLFRDYSDSKPYSSSTGAVAELLANTCDVIDGVVGFIGKSNSGGNDIEYPSNTISYGERSGEIAGPFIVTALKSLSFGLRLGTSGDDKVGLVGGAGVKLGLMGDLSAHTKDGAVTAVEFKLGGYKGSPDNVNAGIGIERTSK